MKYFKTFSTIMVIQLIVVSAVFAGSLGGKVYINSEPSKAVADAEVQLMSLDPSGVPGLYSTKSDDNGNYYFENLPEGTYDITVIFEDYVSGYEVVDVPAGEIMINLDIFLFKDGNMYSSSLEGTISDRETGLPIAWTHVSLVPNGMLPFLLSAYTDNSGKYKFYNIPNGNYNIRAEKFGYEEYEYNDIIEIKDSVKIIGVDFTMIKLTPDASLSGIITNSKTGEVIKGAIVTLNNEIYPAFVLDSITIDPPISDSLWNNSYYSTETDENGFYEFNELYSGNYWFSCYAEDFEEIQRPISIDGEINLNFELVPRITGTISGNVFFDDTDNLVENAWIEFIPVTSDVNMYWEFTSTDEFGNYKAKVPVGSYYIACSYYFPSLTDYYYYREFYDDVQSMAEAKIITVTENEVIENINFGLASPKGIEISVTGKVTDDDGNPLADAMVYLYANSNCYWAVDSTVPSILPPNAITDSEGKYEIKINRSILSSISFKLSAEKDGFITEFYLDKPDWFSAEVFTVEDNASFENVDFTLTPYITTENRISGNVTDADGLPLPNVFVFGQALNSIDNTYPTIFDFPWAITDSDGNYSLENLKNEEYIIVFFGKDLIPEFYDDVYTWEEATRVLADGYITGIDATLDNYNVVVLDSNGNLSSKNISGIIEDTKGNKLSGVFVTLKDQNGKAIGSAQSESNGSYSIIVSSSDFSSITATKFGYESYSSQVSKNSSVQNFSLNQTVTDVDKTKDNNIPSKFSLAQNYPNPFNPSTSIEFKLPSAEYVTLTIYNLIGQKITTLVDEHLDAGTHQIKFDAGRLNSGIYIYKISAGNFTNLKKMILLK